MIRAARASGRILFPAPSLRHGGAAGGRIASGYDAGSQAYNTFAQAGRMGEKARRYTEAGDIGKAMLFQSRRDNLRSSGRAFMSDW